MVFTQIWYLHKKAVWDRNNILANYAEFTLQWRNYPIWRYTLRWKNTNWISSSVRNIINIANIIKNRLGCYYSEIFVLETECSYSCWTNCLEILTGLEDSVLGQGSWEIQLIQIWTIPTTPGSTFPFSIVVFIKGDRTGFYISCMCITSFYSFSKPRCTHWNSRPCRPRRMSKTMKNLNFWKSLLRALVFKQTNQSQDRTFGKKYDLGRLAWNYCGFFSPRNSFICPAVPMKAH